MNADPEGVRVFFVSPPATTGGSGSVTVRNADGTADFNSTDQPFFRYEQALAPGVRSLRKTWEWTVPTSVESFTFLVGVAASLLDENDIQAGPKFVTTAIASDSTSTCVIDISGQAFCWGEGNRGRLGNGSTEDQPTPVPVDQGSLRFVAIGAGIAHGCALTDTGEAYCWGAGNLGRLGNGESGNMTSPVPVLGGHTFVQLTASRVSTCALTEDGTAYCWGYNNLGQLGNGTTDNADVPTPVAGGLKFKQISAGRFHTCGVTIDNKAYCWGSPGNGRLGNGVIGGDSIKEPAPVQGSYEFSHIAAGNTHTCALTPEGKAYCWGGNSFGRLGIGKTDNQPIPVPTEVAGGHSFRKISVGGLHTCAVSHEGKAYCWGSQARGKVGNGQTAIDSIFEPFEVPGLSNVTDIVAAADHTCATTADGKVYCWGNGRAGRLGNGMMTNQSKPTQVSGLTGVAWLRDDVEACVAEDGFARCSRPTGDPSIFASSGEGGRSVSLSPMEAPQQPASSS